MNHPQASQAGTAKAALILAGFVGTCPTAAAALLFSLFCLLLLIHGQPLPFALPFFGHLDTPPAMLAAAAAGGVAARLAFGLANRLEPLLPRGDGQATKASAFGLWLPSLVAAFGGLATGDSFSATLLFGFSLIFFAMEWFTSHAAKHRPSPLDEARAYLVYGRKGQAIECLEQALRQAPDRTDIAAMLEEIKGRP